MAHRLAGCPLSPATAPYRMPHTERPFLMIYCHPCACVCLPVSVILNLSACLPSTTTAQCRGLHRHAWWRAQWRRSGRRRPGDGSCTAPPTPPTPPTGCALLDVYSVSLCRAAAYGHRVQSRHTMPSHHASHHIYNIRSHKLIIGSHIGSHIYRVTHIIYIGSHASHCHASQCACVLGHLIRWMESGGCRTSP